MIKCLTRRFFRLPLLLLSSGIFEPMAVAEPWLSSRFAQNCAACHAPGRRNLPPILRRCTLSCQSCHVNPNGGGLRSFYGKWNENLWLRSNTLKQLNHQNLPAPIHKQFYSRSTKNSVISKNIKNIIRQGFPLVRSRNEEESELLYDRYHDKLHQSNARSRREFEFSIPQSDPYRLMDERSIDGGGDFRLVAVQQNGDGVESDLRTFLMEATFGLRYRPLRNTHIVYEARYVGPQVGQTLDGIPGQERTRSIYLMQDDLPWNIFVMGGFYKPLFGNYTPDQTALAQVMTASALGINDSTAQTLYKAVSVGAAPNVPYGNLHYIIKRIDPVVIIDEANNTSQTSSQIVEESGVAGNFGLRFVTLGAQVNYSFWSTTDSTDKTNEIKVEMHAFEVRGTLGDYVLGLELISLGRDEELSDFRQGGLFTLEGKYKIYKEAYLTAEYAQSNGVSRSILPGATSQVRAGARYFLYPGVELSFQYSIDKETREPSSQELSPGTSSITTISFMVHTFF